MSATITQLQLSADPSTGYLSTFYGLLATLKDSAGNTIKQSNVQIDFYANNVLYSSAVTNTNGMAFRGWRAESYGVNQFYAIVHATGLVSNGATITVMTATGTVPPSDTTAPTLSINQPSSLNGVLPLSFILTGTASDASGIARVEVTLDGSAVAVTGTTSWSANLSIGSTGSHTIAVKAVDTKGNSASKSLTCNVQQQVTATFS